MEELFGPKDTGPRKKKMHPSVITFSGVWLKKKRVSAFQVQSYRPSTHDQTKSVAKGAVTNEDI